MHHLARAARSLTVAPSLVLATTGVSFTAIQEVELSETKAPPGATVTLRVEMSERTAGTELGGLFLIPGGTFGDAGPEMVTCDAVGAAEAGQIHWQVGTVELEGESYSGLVGDGTFTVPQLAPDVYRLAESTEAGGTLCHIFALFRALAPLPDTAMAP